MVLSWVASVKSHFWLELLFALELKHHNDDFLIFPIWFTFGGGEEILLRLLLFPLISYRLRNVVIFQIRFSEGWKQYHVWFPLKLSSFLKPPKQLRIMLTVQSFDILMVILKLPCQKTNSWWLLWKSKCYNLASDELNSPISQKIKNWASEPQSLQISNTRNYEQGKPDWANVHGKGMYFCCRKGACVFSLNIRRQAFF